MESTVTELFTPEQLHARREEVQKEMFSAKASHRTLYHRLKQAMHERAMLDIEMPRLQQELGKAMNVKAEVEERLWQANIDIAINEFLSTFDMDELERLAVGDAEAGCVADTFSYQRSGDMAEAAVTC